MRAQNFQINVKVIASNYLKFVDFSRRNIYKINKCASYYEQFSCLIFYA
jgi:hypothetical protein